jgi:hypothetical protein
MEKVMYVNKDLAQLARYGFIFDGARDFLKPEWKEDYRLALDAQPGLVTSPNSAIPAILTTWIDPDILRVFQAKNKAAEIFGEVRKGTWTDQTVIFPIVEDTGEVSSYSDYNENGRSGANTDFPERQTYLFQTMIEYGDLEVERAGLARIGWVAELQRSRVNALNKFLNTTYFYGVLGLANYGILNAPGLSAPIAPSLKSAGGVQWFVGTAPNATANEVYNDLVALYTNLVTQSAGNIDSTMDENTPLTLALSPKSAVALTFTNTFNVNVRDLLAKNYPKLKVVSAVQYGVQSAQNPQGNPSGEFVQLIADEVEGQKTGFCAFNEKLRAHRIVPATSSFKQKMTSGTLGAVIRQPFAVASMLGV